jgi:ATP-dependent helicase YprA (DUF1998 family)
LRVLFSERFGSGAEPYQWQLDVTEAILLGLDSDVIAGTGSGKTIPFMLPLLLHPDKMALVLSPLKILQRDQVWALMLFFFHRKLNHAQTETTIQKNENFRCSRKW